MRMGRGNHVRARGVYLRVNRKCRCVHRMFSFDDLAAMVHQNQIRRADLAEVHPERIHPEMIQLFRVASGDVTGNSFIKSKTRKEAKRCGKHAFAMQTLLGLRGEFRWLRNVGCACDCRRHFSPPMRGNSKLTSRATSRTWS